MPTTDLVHIVDDDASVRDSLAMLLEAAGFPTRTYESAELFLSAAAEHATGCVLTDVRMPGLDGLAMQRRLAEQGCTLPVIVMTGHGDVPLAVAALKTGAVDFLEKPFEDTHLLRAVEDAVAASLRAYEAALESATLATRLATLTPREREVLDHLVAGQPNKTIAYDLGTSPRTVEVHRARIMEKMGARSLAELVRMVVAPRHAPPRTP
jgi:two-component system, LuxR family, response regulator FixJ